MKKLIKSSILMAAGFLVIVIVYAELKNIFLEPIIQSDFEYSTRQLILGGLGESIRAFLTSWLYKYHKTNKSLITNAIQFGMICSALIGSIWLFVGIELVDSENELGFIIDDGIILLLQGFISGIVLWLIYKREEKPT